MGQPVFGKTAVNGIEYYICLEFSPNGDVYFLTAAKTNDKMYDEYKKEHGSERLCSQSEPVPHSNHALSVPNIQELLGIVKNENTLNQMAGENAIWLKLLFSLTFIPLADSILKLCSCFILTWSFSFGTL